MARPAATAPCLPRPVWACLALYFLASLAHFAHNAEYIAFYPGMPAWLTREQVYLVWLATTSLGVAGLLCSRLGWRTPGAALLAAYGAAGLDGLGHYTLALCSQHTLAMNASIWAEAASGALLAACSVPLLLRRH